MLRTIPRALTVVAATAALAVTAAGAAAADSTCHVQAAMVAAPSVDLVVGETYGAHVAQAAATCVGYEGGSATATLRVWLEYLSPDGAYVPIPDCPGSSTSAPAVAGVHVLVAPTSACPYRVDSPVAGRPYRAHAVLSYAGREYRATSAVYVEAYPVRVTQDGIFVEEPPTICCWPEIGTGP